MLNPFFTQGTRSEQTLVQELIDEHIKMHGLEFIYLPRIFVNIKSILKEVSTSKFDRAFPIEGYIENYQGFGDNFSILTKFGVRSTAEMQITISQRRYADSITPLLEGITGLSKDPTRPLEGDLIYFPLRDILFEVKFVDDINPFYQLQDNYTYTLKCEIFEYEDEVIDTGITEIDNEFETYGYNATLTLLGAGTTAGAYTSLVNGGIHKITLLSGGDGYTADPTIRIAPPTTGRRAQAIAITTETSRGTRSVKSIYITDPGFGYTSIPTVQFETNDGNGSGASAVAGIGTTGSVGIITVSALGSNYVIPPTITFSAPSSGATAIGTAVLNSQNKLSAIRIINAGYGYTQAPTITVSAAGTIGVGTYYYGDIIKGVSTGTTAFVMSWNQPTLTLTARNLTGIFAPGEMILGAGTTSGSVAYMLNTINYDDDDPYENNQEIQSASNLILDFSENNPFGEV
jgi:Virus neck protein